MIQRDIYKEQGEPSRKEKLSLGDAPVEEEEILEAAESLRMAIEQVQDYMEEVNDIYGALQRDQEEGRETMALFYRQLRQMSETRISLKDSADGIEDVLDELRENVDLMTSLKSFFSPRGYRVFYSSLEGRYWVVGNPFLLPVVVGNFLRGKKVEGSYGAGKSTGYKIGWFVERMEEDAPVDGRIDSEKFLLGLRYRINDARRAKATHKLNDGEIEEVDVTSVGFTVMDFTRWLILYERDGDSDFLLSEEDVFDQMVEKTSEDTDVDDILVDCFLDYLEDIPLEDSLRMDLHLRAHRNSPVMPLVKYLLALRWSDDITPLVEAAQGRYIDEVYRELPLAGGKVSLNPFEDYVKNFLPDR